MYIAKDEYVITIQNECATKPNRMREDKKNRGMDQLSKRTTRNGNWLPSSYLPSIYGRVKMLDRGNGCMRMHPMNEGADR